MSRKAYGKKHADGEWGFDLEDHLGQCSASDDEDEDEPVNVPIHLV